MPGPVPTQPQSLLEVLNSCDNYRLPAPGSNQERVVPWLLSPASSAPAIGLLRPAVVAQLRAEPSPSPWHFGTGPRGTPYVSFSRTISTPAARTCVLRDTLARWRDAGLFPSEIGPRMWRGELFTVFRDPFGPRDARNRALDIERAASGLFGIVTSGVHLTVYEEEKRADGAPVYYLWVARRAATKQTWPGYLDSAAAGGIEAGMGVLESVVREAAEEASVPEEMVRGRARAAGTVSYFFRTPDGWLLPEVEYVHELRIPRVDGVAAFEPKPSDGEAERFELLPMAEVINHLRTGMFKYNCIPVLLDFMVRKGIITPDDEPDYHEIVTRLHGGFEYDRWAEQ